MIRARARLYAVLVCFALVLSSGIAFAHKPSDSYLSLDVSGARVDGRWDLAIRDLDYAIGLDADGDGNVTWGELRAKRDAVRDYALAHFAIAADGASCPLTGDIASVVSHSDGTYAVLELTAQCPSDVHVLVADYSLFFDVDRQHRGLMRVSAGGTSRAVAFSTGERRITMDTSDMSAWHPFFAMVKQGIFHIGQGYDHLLFLIALLLASPLRRDDVSPRASRDWKAWKPVGNFRTALIDVARIVTAFTLAHSITLSLAALRIVNLPSRFVESAIAASVILAAVNNVYRVMGKDRWLAAFALGLLHGFGFSATLLDLGLTRDNLMVALFGFNVGVEVGQFTVVALFLPIAFIVRETVFYRRFTLNVGSWIIASVASLWLIERAFAITIFARFF